jgi:hypothetical protein
MGLDDLINQKYHHKTSHNHHDEHGYEDHHRGHFKFELIRSIIKSLSHKKVLLAGALIICTIMIITGIALLWALFPLITKTVGYVETNGIKGVVDSILPFVDKLWKGNGY